MKCLNSNDEKNNNYLSNNEYDYSFEFPLIKVNNLEIAHSNDTVVA